MGYLICKSFSRPDLYVAKSFKYVQLDFPPENFVKVEWKMYGQYFE